MGSRAMEIQVPAILPVLRVAFQAAYQAALQLPLVAQGSLADFPEAVSSLQISSPLISSQLILRFWTQSQLSYQRKSYRHLLVVSQVDPPSLQLSLLIRLLDLLNNLLTAPTVV